MVLIKLIENEIYTNAEAHAAKLVAERIRLNVENDPGATPCFVRMDLDIAEELESSADAHLTLKEIPERGAGGELISSGLPNAPAAMLAIKNPDRVSVDASLDRLDLINQNGVLNMALDAAEAVGARNAAEQMLAHQMAAAHRMSLDLMAQAGNTRDPIERCRLVNASVKLMDVCQKAALTVNRLHTGGQQTVTVQHVQVGDGGQAVVNGAVHTGGLMGRGE
jgi:hypothetical protein